MSEPTEKWQSCGRDVYIEHDDGTFTDICQTSMLGLDFAKAQANARLIAAVPALLKACKDAYEDCPHLGYLKSAIAKAEGREQ